VIGASTTRSLPDSNPSYYRARYYDPSVGRFLTEDPVGFGGRDIDLYRYARNHPTLYNDPIGLVAIDPTFNQDCLPALNRALDIVRKLPKKCDCTFKSTGQHRSLNQLVDDPSITAHYDPSADQSEGGHTKTGDTHNLWIAPIACRMGRWYLAMVLVHELAHINFVPGDGQDDPNGPASTSAYGVARACGLWPLSVPGGQANVNASPITPIEP